MKPGFVNATWVGPYGWRLADGTVLETGVTVVEMPADEAHDSDHWSVQDPKPAAPKAPAVKEN